MTLSAEESPPEETGRRMPRKGLVLVVVILAAALLGGAALIGNKVISGVADPAPPPPAPREASDTPGNFVRFDYTPAQISIGYPSDWVQRRSEDREVGLLISRGRDASMLLRVAPIGIEVTPDTLPVVRSLTDSLVRADGRVELLETPREIVLDGLPGYVYRYLFTTKDGRPGAHVHYFLFKGGKLITLVFQALPASRLGALSESFDQIAGTFRNRVG